MGVRLRLQAGLIMEPCPGEGQGGPGLGSARGSQGRGADAESPRKENLRERGDVNSTFVHAEMFTGAHSVLGQCLSHWRSKEDSTTR